MIPRTSPTASRLLLGALCALAAPGVAHAIVEVTRVADGIWAIQPPAAMRFDESNAAVIVLDDGVLVVDTQTAPSAAREVIAEIRKLTPKPVRWVVNTHWHGDHVQGNSAYREAFPEVEFLAHGSTREDIEKRAKPQIAEDLEGLAAWIERAGKALETGEADGRKLTEEEKVQVAGRLERRRAHLAKLREVKEFVLPDRTFEGDFLLPPTPPRGDPPSSRTIHLRHFAGHTRGDVVVHVPEARVLVTGDLLDDLPYTGHGSPAALVETLRAFGEMDFDVIVPGHGRVRRGEEAREHLRRTADLFDSIVRQTAAAVKDGVDVEEAKKRVDVGAMKSHFVTDEVSGRYWDFFIGEAIARAVEEATAGASP